MSDDQRDSPRAAIRNWLEHTDGNPKLRPATSPSESPERARKPRPRSEAVKEKQPLESRHQDHDGNRSKHRLHRKRGDESRRGTTNTVPRVQRVQSQTLCKQASEPKPGDPGFAEHLGLHAPFRNFKACSDDIEADVGDIARPRKRRRRRSSTSSYLEPAQVDGSIDNEHAYHDSGDEMETGKQQSRHHEIDSVSSSVPSQPSSVAEPLPKKPSASYERRSRRKTRADRYELKETTSDRRKKSAKKDRKDGQERRSKRQKHKEKSGAALMHGFTAQNVVHDRLTVRSLITVTVEVPTLIECPATTSEGSGALRQRQGIITSQKKRLYVCDFVDPD